MLSYGEFKAGMTTMCDLSPKIVERLFILMDVHQIGMVTLENFVAIIEAEVPSQLHKKIKKAEDGF